MSVSLIIIIRLITAEDSPTSYGLVLLPFRRIGPCCLASKF